MTIDIPEEFSDLASERDIEVMLIPYFGWEDDAGEWHEGGEHLVVKKEKIVSGKVYMQAVILDERMLEFGDPERWGLLFDLLERGLEMTIMRAGARNN